MAAATLEVDGVCYDLDYDGHDQPLAARAAGGAVIRLAPWRLDQHLRALGHAARASGGELSLDAAAYAEQVLGDAELLAQWGPLALWWAAGAGDAAVSPACSLRPWTLLERAGAVQAALDPETGRFDTGRFLSLLLAACVRWNGGTDPRTLPIAQGGPLLATACRLCAPEPLLPPAVDDPALRELTMRVCAALGWSPAQVWQADAVEIDRIVALLDRAPGRRPTHGLSTLADLPGTTTIRIDED